MTQNNRKNRSRRFTLRFTDNEWADLSAKTVVEGKGIAEYIRELILADRKAKPASIPMFHNPKFLHQFCLSIALQIMTGSKQMPAESDEELIKLTREIRSYLQEST